MPEPTKFVTEYFAEDVVRTAVGGCCHDFAIAVHRRTGWPIACLWLDPVGDAFSLSDRPAPLHVFCVAPDGRAVDAEGACDLAVLAERYVGPGRDADRLRTEIHGGEADWDRACRENSAAASLAPRERGIAAAERVVAGSPAFLDLVGSLRDGLSPG